MARPPKTALLDRPYLLLIFAAVGWSATGVVARLAVGHVSPMAIVTLRLLIVLSVLAVVARARIASEWRQILPHWGYVLLMGALGYTGFSVFFYFAAHHTTAVNIGLIQGLQPALILAGGFLAYGTRFSARQAAGVLLTLIGVAAVASRGSWDVIRTLTFNIGDLSVLVAATLYSGYSVALRSRPPVSPVTLFAAMTFAAFLVSLPLLAVEAWRGHLVWPDAQGWGLVLFIGLVPSLLSQVAFMRGVALIGSGRAGVFLNLMPVVTAVLGFVVLGETFAAYHAVGLALVLAGIWLAERRSTVV
jgi:drug/metabolite transporter (DMT)-like permease